MILWRYCIDYDHITTIYQFYLIMIFIILIDILWLVQTIRIEICIITKNIRN